MGKASLAETFYADHRDEVEDDSAYLVIYDFKGKKASTRFWENLRRVDAAHVQLSVFITHSRRCAHTVADLASYYGAEVCLFRVEQEEYRA